MPGIKGIYGFESKPIKQEQLILEKVKKEIDDDNEVVDVTALSDDDDPTFGIKDSKNQYLNLY